MAEFSLDKYSEIVEPIEIDIHPDMDPVIVNFRPDGVTRGDIRKFSKAANEADGRDDETDEAMLKAIAGWNITKGGSAIPVSLESLDSLGAVLYGRIAKAIWGNISGNLKSDAVSDAG